MARDLKISTVESRPFYFISYNSEDSEIVKEYVKELEKRGIPMWYDGGMRLSDEWEEKLMDKIRSCEAVIMFLSKNILAKEDSYVLTEFKKNKRFAQKKTYFVLLDKVDPMLVPSKYTDLWNEAMDRHALEAFAYTDVKLCMNTLVKELGYTSVADNASVQKGEIKNKRIEFECGDVYEGAFKDGLMHGKGTYIWADGDKYIGDFNENLRTGKGTYTWGPDSPFCGDTYTGDFLNNTMTGIGTYTWGPNSKYAGDKYEGAFYCGTKYGKGVYTFSSGNVYDGSFVNDEMTGIGIFINNKRNESYVGEYKNGKRHGKGTYYYANGSVYKGDFADGKASGDGTLTYADGSRYVGAFANGKRHGRGTLFSSDGKILYKGVFVNDKQRGK